MTTTSPPTMTSAVAQRVAWLQQAYKSDANLTPADRTAFATFIFSDANLGTLVPHLEHDLDTKYTWEMPEEGDTVRIRKLAKVRRDAWELVYASLRLLALSDIEALGITSDTEAQSYFMLRSWPFIGGRHHIKTKDITIYNGSLAKQRTHVIDGADPNAPPLDLTGAKPEHGTRGRQRRSIPMPKQGVSAELYEQSLAAAAVATGRAAFPSYPRIGE